MKPKINILSAIISIVTSQLVLAGSATWNAEPGTDDWFTATNWTPETVPNGNTDTATFNVSNITAVTCRGKLHLAGIIFNPGASAYNINIKRPSAFTGDGVSNNSSNIQQLSLPSDAGKLNFRNTATAGAATYSVTGGDIFFHDGASAGEASFDMEGLLTNAVIEFYDSSTAGSAEVLNRAGDTTGAANFYDNATAGTATFTCEGGSNSKRYPASISFNDESSASDGTFFAEAASVSGGVGGLVDFYDDSTANNATLSANGAKVDGAFGGFISFDGSNSTAGAATLTANGGTNGGLGGKITFTVGSQGKSARVVLSGNGQLDISSHDAPGVTIGSLEGDGGSVLLGSNNLTVGRNNLDATFSGVIDDGGAGGSFTKVGGATLSLVGANTYTGTTTVEGGYLIVSNQVGSATGTGPIVINGGTFGGQGGVIGPVTVGTGTGFEPYLEPGARRVPGRLVIERELTFNDDGEFQWQLNSDRATCDHVVSNGVTIIGEAEIHFDDFGNSVLPVGIIFTVFSNTARTPINGVFDELPDGGTVTIGSNTFQANYEGGDGNDLTLTVIP